MTWYNSNYNFRQIVGVDCFGGGGSSATVDVEIVVPSDWDTFWTTIKSNFFDVVVTTGKGQLVNYSRSGANYSNRTLTLQVDGLAITNDDAMSVLYVYYGYADETTDRSVATTISSAKTGHILLERPYARIVNSSGARTGVDAPTASFSKGTLEEVDIFFNTNNMFGARQDTYNQRLGLEGIDYIKIKSYDSAGSHDDARVTEAQTRVGNNFIRARFKAGSNNTSYAATVQIVTTLAQTIESRCILRTKDLLPE